MENVVCLLMHRLECLDHAVVFRRVQRFLFFFFFFFFHTTRTVPRAAPTLPSSAEVHTPESEHPVPDWHRER